MAWLNLWRHLRTQQKEMGSSAFRRMCRQEHLNYLRVREWQDFESQLRQVAKQVGLKPGYAGRRARRRRHPPGAARPGCSPTSGCATRTGATTSARAGAGSRSSPGSGLFKSQPDLVMAAELVETSRLWGRQNAAIDPLWAERLGGDLVKRTWSEPHWSKKRESALAHERVTLYGVPLVADRVVPLGRHQPDVARELFVRHALVQGEWRARHRFFETNRRLLEEAAELEHRARRHDIVVDEETLFDFYDARVPAEVVSGAHFDTWWKQERRDQPGPAHLRPGDAGARGRRARRGRLPRRVARGTADAAAELPLRAGSRGRRRHHRRAARHPEHRRRGAVHLERARPAARAGHRPDPLAAQAAAGELRAGPRRRAPVPRGRAAGGGAAARRAVALPALAHRRARAPRVLGPREGAGPPAARPSGSLDDQGAEVGVGKDLEALKEPLRPSFDRAMQAGRRRVGRERDRADHVDLRHHRAVVHADPRRSRGARLPDAGRRGQHGRAAGRRLGRRAGGPAPARRTTPAAARASRRRSPRWSTGSTTPPSSGWPPRRTRTSAR